MARRGNACFHTGGDGGFAGNARLFDLHALVPRLGLFQEDPSKIPYDFDELLAEIAPRPTLLVTPSRDRNADPEAVAACVSAASAAWPPGALATAAPDGPTTFGANETALLVEWVTDL